MIDQYFSEELLSSEKVDGDQKNDSKVVTLKAKNNSV